MLLNAGEDAVVPEERCGLLGAVESLVANVFLPSIENQSLNSDTALNESVKAELVNSLSSFVHVLTSMSCCLEYSSFFTTYCIKTELKVRDKKRQAGIRAAVYRTKTLIHRGINRKCRIVHHIYCIYDQ